jgi:hypothetical protein
LSTGYSNIVIVAFKRSSLPQLLGCKVPVLTAVESMADVRHVWRFSLHWQKFRLGQRHISETELREMLRDNRFFKAGGRSGATSEKHPDQRWKSVGIVWVEPRNPSLGMRDIVVIHNSELVITAYHRTPLEDLNHNADLSDFGIQALHAFMTADSFQAKCLKMNRAVEVAVRISNVGSAATRKLIRFFTRFLPEASQDPHEELLTQEHRHAEGVTLVRQLHDALYPAKTKTATLEDQVLQPAEEQNDEDPELPASGGHVLFHNFVLNELRKFLSSMKYEIKARAKLLRSASLRSEIEAALSALNVALELPQDHQSLQDYENFAADLAALIQDLPKIRKHKLWQNTSALLHKVRQAAEEVQGPIRTPHKPANVLKPNELIGLLNRLSVCLLEDRKLITCPFQGSACSVTRFVQCHLKEKAVYAQVPGAENGFVRRLVCSLHVILDSLCHVTAVEQWEELMYIVYHAMLEWPSSALLLLQPGLFMKFISHLSWLFIPRDASEMRRQVGRLPHSQCFMPLRRESSDPFRALQVLKGSLTALAQRDSPVCHLLNIEIQVALGALEWTGVQSVFDAEITKQEAIATAKGHKLSQRLRQEAAQKDENTEAACRDKYSAAMASEDARPNDFILQFQAAVKEPCFGSVCTEPCPRVLSDTVLVKTANVQLEPPFTVYLWLLQLWREAAASVGPSSDPTAVASPPP